MRAAGTPILRDVQLRIDAGEHVAVVGRSGAGKSSLAAVLLGLYRPSRGAVYVDGEPLVGAWLDRVRAHTAWVDPEVRLWSERLLDNLRYGSSQWHREPMAQVLEEAGLLGVLGRLERGLQTHLGEGGALVSGGEGQRVRFGRALLRGPAQLAVLDEAFRGLDRATRRALLLNARRHWRAATLLYVTHDLDHTVDFDRVLVVEDGRIVEDGAPGALLSRSSRYRALMEADARLRLECWGDGRWRRLTVREGIVSQEPRPC